MLGTQPPGRANARPDDRLREAIHRAAQNCFLLRRRPGLELRCAIAHRGTHTPRPALLKKGDHDQPAKQLLPVVMGPGSRPGRRGYGFAFSRRCSPEVCQELPALSNQRAQGMPDARCTRDLVCSVHKEVRTRAYRFSGEHPTFPAQWLYGLLRALLGEPCTFATVAPKKRELLRRLTPASGRQDHTTSPYASVAIVSRNISVHRNPSLVVTMANAPLNGTGWLLM